MGQSADEVGAVDRKSFGEDKNQFRPRAGKPGAEPDAGSRGIGGGVDARRRGGEVRLLKLRNRDDQRPVGDLAAYFRHSLPDGGQEHLGDAELLWFRHEHRRHQLMGVEVALEAERVAVLP